jgi:SAM-dependent methyltransferase/uncharacterized protein YbaR (Trm112 family)
MVDVLPLLACPRDRGRLRSGGLGLACPMGHEFPVVDGVPVLLLEEDTPTIGVATASLSAARRSASGEIPEDPWFTSTLGISEAEKLALLTQAGCGRSPIDPVARFLVAATNGILYQDLVGEIPEYPVPELRLPAGEGRLFLDIGCSWGRWSIAAARQGYRVVGIDPSLGAVMAARRITQTLGLDAVFVVGDARRLPFFDGLFDVAFSYSVLQHFSKSDALGALGEVSRVLGAGGRSLVQMANRFGIRCLYHQARRSFRQAREFEVRYWASGELQASFEAQIGPSHLSVDCFFGIGLQASDAHLMSGTRKRVLRLSELLRSISARHRWLLKVADSLYVDSTKIVGP